MQIRSCLPQVRQNTLLQNRQNIQANPNFKGVTFIQIIEKCGDAGQEASMKIIKPMLETEFGRYSEKNTRRLAPNSWVRSDFKGSFFGLEFPPALSQKETEFRGFVKGLQDSFPDQVRIHSSDDAGVTLESEFWAADRETLKDIHS